MKPTWPNGDFRSSEFVGPIYTNSLTIDMQFRGHVCSPAALACKLKTDMRSVNSLEVLFPVSPLHFPLGLSSLRRINLIIQRV